MPRVTPAIAAGLSKGVERIHLLAQLAGFRIGDKAAQKRADDLLHPLRV